MLRHVLAASLLALSGCASLSSPSSSPRLRGEALDREVERLMTAGHVPGLALAVIENGRIVHLRAYGKRDLERDLPLTVDTTMYAASITKALFAYAVMTLVDEGRLDLDRSIAQYLPKPLPQYPKYAGHGWRRALARNHAAHAARPHGWLCELPLLHAGRKLRSERQAEDRIRARQPLRLLREGINLMQFVIDNGLQIDTGELIQSRVFDRFGMRGSGLVWREAFAANLAIGYDEAGKPLGHKQRGSVRAAGSMDTTLEDYAGFLAALARCEGLSAKSCGEMKRARIAIRSVQQFPTLSEDTTTDNDSIHLAGGLGVVAYDSPQGRAWFKGGHDDGTRNLAFCLDDKRDCVLILSNSSNGDGLFKYLADTTLGPTCLPWFWVGYVPYDHPQWRQAQARRQSHPPCAPLPR